VLIFGATRNTGLEVAKILIARGQNVTAFVRPTSSRGDIAALGADFVEGDALDLESVQAAFVGHQYSAVITTLGCFGCDTPPDYIGNRNVFDAAKAAGVARVIMISSIGAGNSQDAIPWIAGMVLGDTLELKTQAENHLIASGLKYTIIRPGSLSEKPTTGTSYLSDDPETFGAITRPDLAELIVGSLDDDTTIGKVYGAVDTELSWPWSMF
jgi:uncharacterized protein YbjT (DUF2867 family)